MIFCYKKPKSIDIDYIEYIFQILVNGYSNLNFKLSKVEILPKLLTFDELKSYLMCFSNELKIEIDIYFDENENRIIHNLPITCFPTENETAISVTSFGLKNYEITICEYIFILIELKLKKDNIISFEGGDLDDLEKFYRPFYVCAAIFFGFGNHLLSRFWISGEYKSSKNEIRKYKYYVPLKIETMVYGQVLIESIIEKRLKNLIEFNSFERIIKKEKKNCRNYIRKGKSIFFNQICIK